MATTTAVAPMTAEEKKVIFASSLGTIFEWYDFYLFGVMAAVIAKKPRVVTSTRSSVSSGLKP